MLAVLSFFSYQVDSKDVKKDEVEVKAILDMTVEVLSV